MYMNSRPLSFSKDLANGTRERSRSMAGKSVRAVAAIVIIIGVILVIRGTLRPRNDSRPPTKSQAAPTEEERDAVLIIPGIREPGTLTAEEATVPDHSEVIGIEAGGAHRAYLLDGMSTPPTHVVNDLPGGVPVSVAYCKLRDCATAYTGARPTGVPLDLGVYALFQGHLVLMAKGGAYFQEPTEAHPGAEQPDRLPYQSYPFERTTWGTWRHKHPDTDIFVGDRRSEN
jgi:hypothetical protein